MRRILSVELFVIFFSTIGNGAFARTDGIWCGKPFHTGEPSAVTGALQRQAVWGPPNYGATPKIDKKYNIWVLKTDYPLPVYINGEFDLPLKKITVRTLQLIGPDASEHGFDDFQQRHVLVIGRLMTQIFPGDYTPVTIETKGIQLSGNVSCDGRMLLPKT